MPPPPGLFDQPLEEACDPTAAKVDSHEAGGRRDDSAGDGKNGRPDAVDSTRQRRQIVCRLGMSQGGDEGRSREDAGDFGFVLHFLLFLGLGCS